MGAHLRSGIADLQLRHGDTLLVQTERSRLDRLREAEDFVLLEGLHEKLSLQRRAPVVLAITALVIVLAALEVFDISILSVGAAALLVMTGCMPMRRAYRSLDLPTLALMAGTVSLGVAMSKTGAADLLAHEIFGGVATLVGAGEQGACRAGRLLGPDERPHVPDQQHRGGHGHVADRDEDRD